MIELKSSKSVFEENEITILNLHQFKFHYHLMKENCSSLLKMIVKNTVEFLSEFIDDFVKPRSDRVFMWEEENNLNIGTIYVKDGISEIHYVSIEVGKLIASSCR